MCVVVNRFPTVSETFILRKVQSLVARGFDITVMCHDGRGRDRSIALTDDLLVRCGLGTGPKVAARLAASFLCHPQRVLATLANAVHHFGANGRALKAWLVAVPIVITESDIVHFEFSGIAVTYADALPLLRPARLVVSCRGASEQIAPVVIPGRKKMLASVLQSFDRIHCVTEDMANTISSFGDFRDRIFVNRPAVPVDEFSRRGSAADGQVFRIVSVGRLHWKKSLETLLQAAAILREAGLPFLVEVAGSGPEEEKLRYLTNLLGLEEQVSFLGSKTPADVRDLLSRADVFVLCSISEGLSNAVLEAMALGVPVVSTAVGGMKEVISDDVDGLLVASLNPASLAGAIGRLAANGELRARLGRAARATVVERFDLAFQADSFATEYRRLLALGLRDRGGT